MPADKKQTGKRLLRPLAALAIVWALAGCSPTYTDYSAFVKEAKPVVSAEVYRLAPPDTVTVQSKRVREIHGHRETIRPDGRITLPLVGSVFVAGKTCEEVSQELSLLAQEYYEDAEVTVWVTRFNSKKIFVFGEVASPGPYPYDGTNTVLRTLARAQPSRLADPAKIQILRPSPDGGMRKRMTIDLNRMVSEGDNTLDAMLEEGDIIYVPPNPLAAVGLVFQQILLPITPIASTVQGPADIYDASDHRVYGAREE